MKPTVQTARECCKISIDRKELEARLEIILQGLPCLKGDFMKIHAYAN